jgi:hypothetical protein
MTLKNTAIIRAVALLTAANAQFKIIAEDGSEYGTLPTAPQPHPKARTVKPFPHGERTVHIAKYIHDMQVGEERKIPLGKYKAGDLNVGAYAGQRWGAGSYITDSTPDGITILRVV